MCVGYPCFLLYVAYIEFATTTLGENRGWRTQNDQLSCCLWRWRPCLQPHCGWIELSWQWYAIYNTESKCNKLVKITKSVQTKKLTFTFKVQPEPQSLTLLLFRNITRNQPAGNEQSRVTYWKKNYCRWVDCNVSVHKLEGSYLLTVTNLSYSDFPVGPQVFGNSDSHWRAFSITSQSKVVTVSMSDTKK